MHITETSLPGVRLIEPKVFGDERGFFMETWNQARYAEIGIAELFVQDNLSFSRRGVLRGLHFQEPRAQGKLCAVVEGAVFDVAVDLRAGSPGYGCWFGIELSAANGLQLWVPPGFAHGFQALSASALFSYQCTELYAPEADAGIRWDDPDLAIPWPILPPTLSVKDAALPTLAAWSSRRAAAGAP